LNEYIIYEKNREISNEEKTSARLTLLQEATERSRLGKTKTKQNRNTRNKKQKTAI
jgi:hypothetical protein